MNATRSGRPAGSRHALAPPAADVQIRVVLHPARELGWRETLTDGGRDIAKDEPLLVALGRCGGHADDEEYFEHETPLFRGAGSCEDLDVRSLYRNLHFLHAMTAQTSVFN